MVFSTLEDINLYLCHQCGSINHERSHGHGRTVASVGNVTQRPLKIENADTPLRVGALTVPLFRVKVSPLHPPTTATTTTIHSSKPIQTLAGLYHISFQVASLTPTTLATRKRLSQTATSSVPHPCWRPHHDWNEREIDFLILT